MRHLLTACLLLLALAALPAFVQARDVSPNDGPALGVAFGSDAGGLGGYLAYYFALPHKFGLMPHAGLGWTMARDATTGYSVGLGASYGRRNRIVLDVQLASSASQRLTLHGEHLDTHAIYALGLVAGWEWLSKSGFFVRANLGPAFMFLPPLYGRSDAWTIAGNLVSFGAKLW